MLLRPLVLPTGVAVVVSLWAATASAHFLFIRIGTHAEAGRAVEVFFSEVATAGDPRLVPKIAPTRLWLQEQPGEFRPLEVQRGVDRLRAYLPSSGAVSVVGSLEYGVLQRNVPFLLQYYPKAVAGDPQQVNTFRPRPEQPLEIIPTITANEIKLVALHQGKPVPEAVFTTVDEDLVNDELRADKSGMATWQPPQPGHYCVYTRVTLAEEGKHQGEPYTEIRRFATLAFHWPLQRQAGDAEATAMFQRAIAARASWSEDFPGFTARIDGYHDGRPFAGNVRLEDDGALQLELDDATASEWVEGQLDSIAMHRQASSRDSNPILQFADRDEDHSLGRLLIFVGGQFASSYRVLDDQIRVVNRNLGSQNMTITVLDNLRNQDGKYLPRTYTVHYWDAKSGNLLRTQTVQQRWKRVIDWDLPSELIVTRSSQAGFGVRSFRLSNHQLIPGN